jgi:Ca-activated chloride channel family protein
MMMLERRPHASARRSTAIATALLTTLLLASLLSGCSYGGAPAGRDAAPVGYTMNAERAPAGPGIYDGVPEGRVGGEGPAEGPAEGSAEGSAENYARIDDNPFVEVSSAPLSTFSIDVDTASYSNVRRFLQDGQLPPRDAVRIEELVNYFSYDYPQPVGDVPFSVTAEVADCPWNGEHRLMQVGLKGKEIVEEQRPPSNLVFLVDTSGSMDDPRKLPLVKESMAVLVSQLGAADRVAMVTYAGSSGLALDATPGDRKAEIMSALDRLSAGGSTNGGAGIELAYRVAEENLVPNGNNRVILATDGDFNVGATSREALVELIEAKRQKGIFLTVLGLGTGNLQDATMEALADKGNGTYAYVDSIEEGRRVFGRGLTGTLFTIAKDVKIQVEFNPKRVAGYRLIGYENRLLADRDFDDDAKDAGEIGAGHTVTALYEIVPAGRRVTNPEGVRPLRYQQPGEPTAAATSGEVATIALRYKLPKEDASTAVSVPVADARSGFEAASRNLRFASAVAAFGMLLRESPYKGTADFDGVLAMARDATGADLEGDRAEFLGLVERAKALGARSR